VNNGLGVGCGGGDCHGKRNGMMCKGKMARVVGL
jgi:hypothetical protein